MDYSEKWGKDEEEAIRLALIDLKLTRDEVDVEILEESSKGFFGIGSKLAKVRVTKKASLQKEEKAVEPVREERKSPAEGKRNGGYASEKRGEKKEKRNQVHKKQDFDEDIKAERPDDLVPVEKSPALDFLKDVTDKMGIEVTVTASENESSIYIDINGKDSGTVIGKRGQTLDAIQYLTRLVVNKDDDKYKRVVVDAENYRAKREKTLEQLANRLADKVQRTKRSVRLEPMNPYERKIIHATLQGNSRIITRSEGEDPYRRVVIELK